VEFADRRVFTDTRGVGIYSMELQGRIIQLIDTPGFNDTWRSDLDVLKEIAFLLCQVYRHGVRLAGIIYLHRISDNRVSGSAMKNFAMLERICGPEATPSVFLVSTMWDLVDSGKIDPRKAVARESELKSKDDFWGRLCRQGSQVKRSREDDSSALSILTDLVTLHNRDGPATLRIQKELVDQGKELHETIAGQELSATYDIAERECYKKLDLIKRDMLGWDPDLVRNVSELNRELETVKNIRKELRVRLQSLATQRERSYSEVLSSVRHEQQKMAAELEENRCKYKQIKEEMQDNLETFKEEQKQWELKHASLGRDQSDGRRSRNSMDLERQQMEDEASVVIEQFNQLQSENEEEKARIEEISGKLRKREVVKRNLLPFLGMLAGGGIVAAGAVTGMTPLLGVGVNFAWQNASMINLSRRRENEGTPKNSANMLTV
jgi:hypothetical protein